MHEFEARFGHWIIRYRWAVIALTLIGVFIAASGGSRVVFSDDYRVFFAPENPQLQAFEALEATYTKNDNVLIVLAPKDGDVFTPKTLAAVEQVTERAWQMPYSIRVDSISNFQHTEAEGDDLIVRDLVEHAEGYSPRDIAQVRRVALNEPQLVNRLVSPDARVTGINVIIQLPGVDKVNEGPEVTRFSRALVEQIKAEHPELDVYLTGMVMLNNAFNEASILDMQSLIPIGFGLMILILAVMLRNIMLTLSTVMIILFAIMSAMGLGGYLGYPMTPISASAPTIILTVAIANCVHVLVTFLYELRHGADRRAAVVESLRVNLQPLLLTSVTTSLGFLSLNFSESPPFRHLGNFVALGVAASFIFSVTFLPAIMTLLPTRARHIDHDRHTAMDRVAEFVINRRRALLWGISALTLVMVAMIPRNYINEVFVEYFDKSIQFRTDTDFVNKTLGGLYSIDYSLDTHETGGVSNPEFLKKLEAFGQWWQEQPETVHVNTLSDVMKRLNKSMHGDDPSWYRIPESRELAAQYLLLYEMSLPYGLDLNNQLNVDKSATRFSATVRVVSTDKILALEHRAGEWLRANAPELSDAEGSSTVIMFSHISKRNFNSMMTGTLSALLMISLLLILALRSLKIGLISLIPNLVPAAIGFGLWGLFISEMNLSVSIVIAVTLGIVVDDTVHFLSKYLRGRREKNLNAQDAVRYAFSRVGTALLVTTLVLMTGFLVLTQSSFLLNSTMGLMTAMVLAIALALDFLLLPALLMKLEEKSHEKTAAADALAEPARP